MYIHTHVHVCLLTYVEFPSCIDIHYTVFIKYMYVHVYQHVMGRNGARRLCPSKEYSSTALMWVRSKRWF